MIVYSQWIVEKVNLIICGERFFSIDFG